MRRQPRWHPWTSLTSSAVQVGHADARPGTLQKQPPLGSYTAGPWTQRKSGTVPHAQTGLICVVSSAVTARVTKLPRLPGGTLHACRKHTIAPPTNPNSVPKEKHLFSDLKPPGTVAGILFVSCSQFKVLTGVYFLRLNKGVFESPH